MMEASAFRRAFSFVVGEEGGFTDNLADPGNWTGGQCGVGRCLGTKFGVSAAAYPGLDIASLTLMDAQVIYRRDYWDRIHGDLLPPPLALLVFDAAVNNGVVRAIRWLQLSLGVPADGLAGEQTFEALRGKAGDGARLLGEFQSLRMMFMVGLPTWRSFGAGWARRLCRLPFEAIQMGGP